MKISHSLFLFLGLLTSETWLTTAIPSTSTSPSKCDSKNQQGQCLATGHDDDVDKINPPVSGFIRVKSSSLGLSSKSFSLVLRTLRKVNRTPVCMKMTIANQPNPNDSPLVGENLFYLVNGTTTGTAAASASANGLINDHFYWSNGHEYISFIPHEHGAHGNWLIGIAPGEDSGYVYMEADGKTSLTPIDNDFDTYSWKWLQKGRWVDQPDMRMVCLDGQQQQQSETPSKSHSHNHFYEVEYFDPRDKTSTSYTPLTAYLVTDIYPKQFISAGFTVVPKLLPSAADRLHGLLDLKNKKLHVISDLEVLTTYGGLSLIDEEEKRAVMVNVEHSTGSWRITYRYLAPLETNTATATASTTTIGGKISITGNRKLHIAEGPREITVELNTLQGFVHGDKNSQSIAVSSASNQYLRKEKTSLMQQLLGNKVQVGDYLWTWYSPVHDSIDTGKGKEEGVEELLLHCRARIGSSKFVFEYHLAHRMEVMRRTVLSSDIDLLVIDLDEQEEGQVLIQGKLGRKETEEQVQLHQIVYIGEHVVDFILDYMDYKEGVLGGLSSCYMYHAAYSLPQQLLYANEILCVLMGAKPVTMIQYTSPSEHQWKFPLVRELSQGIIAAKQVYGDSFPFDYEIFKYRQDESLIIYHTKKEHLMNAIRPHHSAQALHPMPFLEDETMALRLSTAKEQVYNSAYNGFVLGYPDRFVMSYCEGLVGDRLTTEQKHEQYFLAKRDYEQEMGGFYEIKVGLVEGCSREQLDFVANFIR